jgi:hypothetical protein
MLQHNPFYWGTIRKVVVAFGAIFSDIHVVRMDKDGNPVKKIEVPCEFGPKEKWMHLNTQNPQPGVDDSVEMVLPRMSYEISGFTYDSDRKLTSTGNTVRAVATDKKAIKTQFNPTPWNIGFTLNIMTKTMEDGLMIVEQILPFFSPDYTVTIKDIPDLELSKDIPIILNSVEHNDDWDGQLQQRRTVTWTLAFTAKMYLYPPVGLSKLNLKTNIVWHLSQSMTADVTAQDIVTPTPDSTPDFIVPIITQTLGPSIQQLHGRARIRRVPTQNQRGVANIIDGVPTIPNAETQSGVTRITNPMAFHPGFQEEPVQTETELVMQLQKGKTRVRVTRSSQTTGTTRIRVTATAQTTGTSAIEVTTTQNQPGISNISNSGGNHSFDPGFQQGSFQ